MSEIKFLKWLSSDTCTKWWHDSANPDEIIKSLKNGATGITTNPSLIAASLASLTEFWMPVLRDIPRNLEKAEKAEEILKQITQKCARIVEPVFHQTSGKQGYACAQVNPLRAVDSKFMFEMAKRLSQWAPNISVKLPVTAAGLDVLEECAAIGITVMATVSFTLPQVLAVAERYRKGLVRARKAGVNPGQCFAVLMVGRIDDYIRDVAKDNGADVFEPDILQCGTAIMKRAYTIFKKKNYETVLVAAGMRGAYHASDLAGGDLVLSVHPKIQAKLAQLEGSFEEHINIPVDERTLDRLSRIPEFVRAYEPDGLKLSEFITYGIVQKTLAQFVETGWTPIETFKI